MRYSTLGVDAINSSEDNKVSTYALLDKISFDRQRYRLGHTIIFFRAGALAALEEVCSLHGKAKTCFLPQARDELLIILIRKIQGEVFKRIRAKVYQKKYDQRSYFTFKSVYSYIFSYQGVDQSVSEKPEEIHGPQRLGLVYRNPEDTAFDRTTRQAIFCS